MAMLITLTAVQSSICSLRSVIMVNRNATDWEQDMESRAWTWLAKTRGPAV